MYNPVGVRAEVTNEMAAIQGATVQALTRQSMFVTLLMLQVFVFFRNIVG